MFKTEHQQSAPWLEYIAPSQEDLDDISTHYQIPLHFLRAALTPQSLARAQHQQDWQLIVCHVPVLGQHSAEYQISSFALLIRQQQLILISPVALSIFDVAIQRQQSDHSPDACQRAVINLLQDVADQFIAAIQQVNVQIMQVESEIAHAIKNRQIFGLLAYSKTLNRMANALSANHNMLIQLQIQQALASSSSLNLDLADVCVETEQAQAMAEIQNTNLCNLIDAYAAAVENNLSMLVQYLSIYVIIGAIPLGISSIFGMNIPLPWHDQPWALFYLGVISILISALMLFILKKRQII